MGDHSQIQGTDATWNPVIGFRRVSEGFRNCYAESVSQGMVRMLRGVVAKTGSAEASAPLDAYENAVRMDDDVDPRSLWSGSVSLRPEHLDVPLRWSEPRRIFVNSMSDLFHEDVPNEFIAAVFGVMAASPQHTFQVLTKRPERMLEWFRWIASGARHSDGVPGPSLECAWQLLCQEAAHHPDGIGGPIHTRFGVEPEALWPLPHVDIGVSVEDQQAADERIPLLLQCPAAVRWVSMEPLLGPVDLGLIYAGRPGDGCGHLDVLEGRFIAATGRPETDAEMSFDDPSACVDWVVVGGESGANARPMHPAWVRDIRDQCADADVPFHFKQWGEWAPDDLTSDCGNAVVVNPDGSTLGITEGGMMHVDSTCMWRVGKKSAGRLLDGVEHNGWPAADR